MAGQIFIEADEAEVAGLPLGQMHLYLVFRDTDGAEYVIRSGPESPLLPWFGDMKVEVNVPIAASSDARGSETPEDRASTPLDFAGLSDDQAWALMVKYARLIDMANTPYELLGENSNAFIGALLAAAGGDPKSMLPFGVGTDEAVGFSDYPDLLARVPPPSDGTMRGTEGADQIAGIQVDEVILALAGDDAVWAGRGDDQVQGHGGSDRLYGEVGADTLVGGAGKDRQYGGTDDQGDAFIFTARAQRAAGAERDLVFDFMRGVDDLDLREIDARSATAGDDAFAWAGQAAAAHAVWWKATTEGILVRADVTGDASADFEVLLKGATGIGSGDVLL
jgi:hypothetical protein